MTWNQNHVWVKSIWITNKFMKLDSNQCMKVYKNEN
jgi:hypothetical protein